MRRAWKTRVAGWMRRRRWRGFGGATRSMRAASSSAVAIGRGPPGLDDRAGDAAGLRLLAVAAEQGGQLGVRRGSRAARRRERRGSCRSACRAGRRPGSRSRARVSASWKLDRPRSNRQAVDRRRSRPSGATVGELAEVRLAQDEAIAEPGPSRPATLAMAAPSASRPRRRPSGSVASRIRSVCPPPPRVASIWRLPGAGASIDMTSSASTGMCPTSISPPRRRSGSRADPGSACGAAVRSRGR